MAEKQYNTYSIGDELTLIEIDKKTIKGKEYLLLLQQQKPNLIVVGFFEGEQLQIVVNRVIAAELLKTFMKVMYTNYNNPHQDTFNSISLQSSSLGNTADIFNRIINIFHCSILINIYFFFIFSNTIIIDIK